MRVSEGGLGSSKAVVEVCVDCSGFEEVEAFAAEQAAASWVAVVPCA